MLRATTQYLPRKQGLSWIYNVRKYSLGRSSQGSAINADDEIQDDKKTKSKGRVRNSSRFQKVKPKISQIPLPLDDKFHGTEYVKSPDVIRKELKEKYGDKVPEAFIKEMIEASQKFDADVRLSLRDDGSLDMLKFQEDDLKSFLVYIESVIARFYEDLESPSGETQKEGEESLMSRLANMVNPGQLGKSFDKITDGIAENMKPSPTEDLIALFDSLGENLKKFNRDIPLELQSELFNCAIRIPPGKDQDEALYVAGNLIYLNKGLRADPFNEARYINTLIKHKNFVQLEYLWSSRREKDVKGQRFWDEIGILIYIAARNLSKLEILSKSILSLYEYILPSSIIEMIKLHLVLGNTSRALEWVEVFDRNGAKYGFDENFVHRENEVDVSKYDDDLQGFKELNKVENISFEEIYSVIAAFLSDEKYDIGFELTLKYIKLIPNIEDFLLFRYSELPEEIQAGIYFTLSSSKPSLLSGKLKNALNCLAKSEMELKQLMFKRFLQRKSPLLTSDDFDTTLTSPDCYSIIKDFANRGMLKEVNELLTYMQYVKSEKDKGSPVKYLLPPVASVHYIPILQKLGRHKSSEVVRRANTLLLVMSKHGVRPDQYFHTQFLLTLYRKKEFQICIDYIKENFINRNHYISSFKLFDTIWIIYRDANKTDIRQKGVRLSYQDVFELVKFSLKCHEGRQPSISGVSSVIETLLATQKFSLALVYIQWVSRYSIPLDQTAYLKIHNTLLELTNSKELLLELSNDDLRDGIVQIIQQNKLQLLTRDKLLQTEKQSISYSLETIYYLIYCFYRLFWNIDGEQLERQNTQTANDLEVIYSENDGANVMSLAQIQYTDKEI